MVKAMVKAWSSESAQENKEPISLTTSQGPAAKLRASASVEAPNPGRCSAILQLLQSREGCAPPAAVGGDSSWSFGSTKGQVRPLDEFIDASIGFAAVPDRSCERRADVEMDRSPCERLDHTTLALTPSLLAEEHAVSHWDIESEQSSHSLQSAWCDEDSSWEDDKENSLPTMPPRNHVDAGNVAFTGATGFERENHASSRLAAVLIARERVRAPMQPVVFHGGPSIDFELDMDVESEQDDLEMHFCSDDLATKLETRIRENIDGRYEFNIYMDP